MLSRSHRAWLSLWCVVTVVGVTLSADQGTTPTRVTFMVVGDSLSTEYGVEAGLGWVNVLQRRIESAAYHVVNVSMDGQTTDQAVERLPGMLQQHHPGVVVLELGGNDALMGTSVDGIRSHLVGMLSEIHRRGSMAVLCQMRLPLMYATALYTQQFEQMYRSLVGRDTSVVDCFADIASDPSMMQGDGIHLTAIGQQKMFDRLWPALVGALIRRGGSFDVLYRSHTEPRSVN